MLQLIEKKTFISFLLLRDAIITSIINAFTSILSGFVIFSVLGFMAKMAKKDISNVAAGGPGLVFIVYPEAISKPSSSNKIKIKIKINFQFIIAKVP